MWSKVESCHHLFLEKDMIFCFSSHDLWNWKANFFHYSFSSGYKEYGELKISSRFWCFTTSISPKHARNRFYCKNHQYAIKTHAKHVFTSGIYFTVFNLLCSIYFWSPSICLTFVFLHKKFLRLLLTCTPFFLSWCCNTLYNFFPSLSRSVNITAWL